MSLALTSVACAEPLEGSIAGHNLTKVDTALYEVVDNDDVSGLGLVIADSSFDCDELKIILDGAGDPVALDNGRQVAFIHLQILLPPGSSPPDRGAFPIQTDTTSLEAGSPIALAQIRLRQGDGYGLIAELIADDGEISLTPRGDEIGGSLQLQTREGEISGSFKAEACPSLGGSIN